MKITETSKLIFPQAILFVKIVDFDVLIIHNKQCYRLFVNIYYGIYPRKSYFYVLLFAYM